MIKSTKKLKAGEANSKKEVTALLTGATSFVGSHLARRLVTEGWEVHLVIRPQSSLKLIEDIQGQVTLHTHDGSTEDLCQIMASAKPDIVFHLASLFLAQHQTKDVTSLIQSNVLFSTQLVEAMSVNGVNKLVNTGTSWQHFQNEAYNPVCLYAATKQAFEDILKFYVEASDLNVITLKLFDTYGPDDPRPKLFTVLRKAAQEQTELSMSPGEQLIDLVYIDDVIEAFLIAGDYILSDTDIKFESYAVSSGKPIKLKVLVNLYLKISNRNLNIKWGGRSYKEREVMFPWNKAINLGGWYPKVSLEKGIRLMISKS